MYFEQFFAHSAFKKLPSIVIHELGEVDYIARKLPYVKDKLEREKFVYRMTELFTHPHARRLAKKYRLEDIEGAFRKEQLKKQKTENYLKYKENWQCILMTCWALATFPELKDCRHVLRGYNDNANIIDEITDIVYHTNTFTETQENVQQSFHKVIELLKLTKDMTVHLYE